MPSPSLQEFFLLHLLLIYPSLFLNLFVDDLFGVDHFLVLRIVDDDATESGILPGLVNDWTLELVRVKLLEVADLLEGILSLVVGIDSLDGCSLK